MFGNFFRENMSMGYTLDMNVRILRNSTVTHLPILSAKRWGVGGGGGGWV